jgi:hypothetical protein
MTGDVDDLRGWRDWQKNESLTGALPIELQETMAQTVHHLNPAYRNTIGKWLLEPATAELALRLIENFVGHYDHDRATHFDTPTEATPEEKPETEPASSTAPQGLFARVSQRLESKEVETGELSLDSAIESLDKQQREQMIYSLKRQLVTYTKNLNKLHEEAASYGSLSSAPLKLQNEIEEIENTVAELQQKLNILEQE